MTTVDAVIAEVLREWQDAGVSVRSAVSDGTSEFEQKHGVELPQELRAFFAAQGGMADGETDGNDIRFWPLDEVSPASNEVPDGEQNAYDGYFVFADYALWAHGYAVRLSPGQPNDVAIVGGARPIRVASSFKEFLEKYVRDVSQLF